MKKTFLCRGTGEGLPMRCPDCRKKVDADEIYCGACGAALPTAKRKKQDQKLPLGRILLRWMKLLLIILTPALILGALSTYAEYRRGRIFLPDFSTALVPENAEPLDRTLAQWEDFTLHGNFIRYHEDSNTLEILYVAKNRSRNMIQCTDPLVTVGDYQLSSRMHLEVSPKKNLKGSLWIDMEPLQGMNIHRIDGLTLSLELLNYRDSSLLAQTEPVVIPVDLVLPDADITLSLHSLVEEDGLSVQLTGIGTDPASGGIRLYTLMENPTGETMSVRIQNAVWEENSLSISNYYRLPAETRLLTCCKFYEIPSGTAGQLSLEIVTGQGKTHACTVTLSADGSIQEVLQEQE